MKGKVIWHGGKISAEMVPVCMGALEDAADHLLEQANRTIPHETGDMQRSGNVSLDRNTLMAVVSYDTPYARRQHEELGYHHNPGRRARWLSLTLDERRTALVNYVAGRLKAYLGR